MSGVLALLTGSPYDVFGTSNLDPSPSGKFPSEDDEYFVDTSLFVKKLLDEAGSRALIENDGKPFCCCCGHPHKWQALQEKTELTP